MFFCNKFLFCLFEGPCDNGPCGGQGTQYRYYDVQIPVKKIRHLSVVYSDFVVSFLCFFPPFVFRLTDMEELALLPTVLLRPEHALCSALRTTVSVPGPLDLAPQREFADLTQVPWSENTSSPSPKAPEVTPALLPTEQPVTSMLNVSMSFVLC